MTVFMVVTLIVFFAIIGLLWCFRGFSREVRHPRKPVGYAIRLRQVELNPSQAEGIRVGKPEVRRTTTLAVANVISLALLLG